MMSTGRAALETELGETCEPTLLDVPSGDAETLYQMRRDAEGVPAHQPPVAKHPRNAEILGLFHLLLRRAGASQAGAFHKLGGKTIRVVNGAGKMRASVRASFAEPPSLPQADITACVGATDYLLPHNVVRPGRPNDIMRPENGSKWVDFNGARELLGV